MQRFSAVAVVGALVLACLVQGQSVRAQSGLNVKEGVRFELTVLQGQADLRADSTRPSTFVGNVVLTDGHITVHADQAVPNSDMNEFALTGNVKVSVK